MDGATATCIRDCDGERRDERTSAVDYVDSLGLKRVRLGTTMIRLSGIDVRRSLTVRVIGNAVGERVSME